jgi:hypothetical protein
MDLRGPNTNDYDVDAPAARAKSPQGPANQKYCSSGCKATRIRSCAGVV